MDEDSCCAISDDPAGPPAKKRNRGRPNRKWSGDEVSKILEFLVEHNAFEAPTAQIFYRKMSDVAGIPVDWNLLRWKVRNMRTSYQKAVQWQNSTGAGLTENDSCNTIDQKISKMCPNFDKLQDIFGSKETRSKMVIESTDDSTVDVVDEFDDTLSVSSALPDPDPLANAPPKSVRTPSSSAKEFADKMKKSGSKSAISRLSDLQSERNDMQVKKLDFEREKYKEEKELAERKVKLKEEKFQLEKERQQKMLEIEEKKLKIEDENKKCELQLRQEELAMKERIARYELELKYK